MDPSPTSKKKTDPDPGSDTTLERTHDPDGTLNPRSGADLIKFLVDIYLDTYYQNLRFGQ